jgi:hypothetical protein
VIVVPVFSFLRAGAADFFSGGVETKEQLETTLNGLKDECERHIGAGKKVLLQ